MPIQARQDIHFPAIDKLDYNNYIVALNEAPETVEFQFTLNNGANCGTKGSHEDWSRIQIKHPQT